MKKYNWSGCSNILCIRPDNMGDVLMTQPAIRALKQSMKGSKITLLTSRSGARMGRLLPEVDSLIVFDVPWIRTEEENNGCEAVHKLIDDLKGRQFDAAAIFTNYSQSALPTAMICYQANIPRVLAYSRENPYKLINNWVPDHEPFSFPVHGVQRQLNLVAAAGAFTNDENLRLRVENGIAEKRLNELEKEGFNSTKPWLILHPGVSEDKRKYPLELYGQTARLLTQRGYQVVVTGSEQEIETAGCVVKAVGQGCFNLAGKLSLKAFIALIHRAPVIISNNTVSVHIAAAVGTPVVDLYARTNPEHTPWKVPCRVFYFDIPPRIQSKNTTLVHTTPRKSMPLPEPGHIVTAVDELMEGIPLNKSTISLEMMKWSNGKSNGTHTNLQQKQRSGRDPYRTLLSGF